MRLATNPSIAFRRHWRLFSFLGLALAIAVASVVFGQVGAGNRGIQPINSGSDLVATDIHVDVTADNAEEARQKGWREAQRLGWIQLNKKVRGSNGPALSDSALDGIVTAVVVDHEQIGPRRYIATLGILFDRVRAGQILGVSGRVLRSPPMLVIPVYSLDGMQQVFEQRNIWQQAWAEYHTGDSAIDYVRTAGTGPDTLLLNAGQINRRGRIWWRAILDQYGAADVIVPIARLEYSYPGGPITGRFTARFGPDNKLIDSFTMTAPGNAALPDMMKKAVARMDAIYTNALSAGILKADTSLILEKPVKQEELPDDANAVDESGLTAEIDNSIAHAAPTGAASFTVQYSSPDVASVSATERAVGGVAGVQSASTTSLALGGTSVMRVTFRGDLAGLKAALAARGYTVQEGGGTLRISR